MARKEMVATRSLRYGTRMLQAGEPLELDGPKARLYEALGLAEVPAEEATVSRPPAPPPPPPPAAPTADKPKKARAPKKSGARKAKARAKK